VLVTVEDDGIVLLKVNGMPVEVETRLTPGNPETRKDGLIGLERSIGPGRVGTGGFEIANG